MTRVRIKPGRRHGFNPTYTEGDELEVSQNELDAFGDKFEIVEDAAADPEPEPLPDTPGTDLLNVLDYQLAQMLASAGLTTMAAVKAASNKELLEIPGIGRATVTKIREVLNE